MAKPRFFGSTKSAFDLKVVFLAHAANVYFPPFLPNTSNFCSHQNSDHDGELYSIRALRTERLLLRSSTQSICFDPSPLYRSCPETLVIQVFTSSEVSSVSMPRAALSMLIDPLTTPRCSSSNLSEDTFIKAFHPCSPPPSAFTSRIWN